MPSLSLLDLMDVQVFTRLITCSETSVYTTVWTEQALILNSNNKILETLVIGVQQQDSSVLLHGTDRFEIRSKIRLYNMPENNI